MSTILKWALIMFLVSLVAALFGFTGLSAASADVARILFFYLHRYICSVARTRAYPFSGPPGDHKREIFERWRNPADAHAKHGGQRGRPVALPAKARSCRLASWSWRRPGRR